MKTHLLNKQLLSLKTLRLLTKETTVKMCHCKLTSHMVQMCYFYVFHFILFYFILFLSTTILLLLFLERNINLSDHPERASIIETLQDLFLKSEYCSPEDMESLHKSTNINKKSLRGWFETQRMIIRKGRRQLYFPRITTANSEILESNFKKSEKTNKSVVQRLVQQTGLKSTTIHSWYRAKRQCSAHPTSSLTFVGVKTPPSKFPSLPFSANITTSMHVAVELINRNPFEDYAKKVMLRLLRHIFSTTKTLSAEQLEVLSTTFGKSPKYFKTYFACRRHAEQPKEEKQAKAIKYRKLRAHFTSNPNPSNEELKSFASDVGISVQDVHFYFERKRKRMVKC